MLPQQSYCYFSVKLQTWGQKAKTNDNVIEKWETVSYWHHWAAKPKVSTTYWWICSCVRKIIPFWCKPVLVILEFLEARSIINWHIFILIKLLMTFSKFDLVINIMNNVNGKYIKKSCIIFPFLCIYF